MLFPFLNGAAAFPAQLEQELLFLGYKKTQHLYFFWCWSCSPPISRTPNPPGFRDQIPPHPFQLWDTAIPRYLVPKIPSPWEQGIEFLRNERAPKSQFLGPVPGSVPRGDRGHPGQQQDTNPTFSRPIFGVPQPLRKGLWSPALAPECQEEMGKDHKIKKKPAGKGCPYLGKNEILFLCWKQPRRSPGKVWEPHK